MAEDTWMRTHRECFVKTKSSDLGVPEKVLNKALEVYNRSLQDALLDESPYVAEDLKLTLYQARADEIRNKYKNEEQ